MKSGLKLCVLVVAAIMMAHTVAMAKPGPVKVSYMQRFETHSKVADQNGTDYSGESFSYSSISLFRELQKGTFGSLFYLNKYSIDDEEVVSNIGGATIIHMFSKRLTGTFGYTYSSNPERATVVNAGAVSDKDRFSISGIYKFNPDKKHGPVFSLTSSYSTVTDWNEQSSLSEKIEAKFPNIGQKVEGSMSYTYSYSLKQDEQLTNQFLANLSYKVSKKTKITAGVLFIDNVYTFNQGDDTVLRLTLNRSVK